MLRRAIVLIALLSGCTDPAYKGSATTDDGNADGADGADGGEDGADGADGADGGADGGGGDGGSGDGGDGGGGDGGEDGADGGDGSGDGRGIWAWRDRDSPYGTEAIVGDVEAETAMIADLTAWGVDRVYGTYSDRPSSEPAVIAAWNTRLHEAGIQSYALMGDPAWISPDEWDAMDTRIQDRLLLFNAAQEDAATQFDGLHLDIEPHAADDWRTISETQRYDRLMLLLDTYLHARGLVDASETPSLPIAADLPVWYDRLPESLGGEGSVGWPTETDRNAWFGTIGGALTSVSLMAYELNVEADILDRVSNETAMFSGESRIALNEEVGTTWTDINEMFTMAETLEAGGRAVDLHSYARIKAQLP